MGGGIRQGVSISRSVALSTSWRWTSVARVTLAGRDMDTKALQGSFVHNFVPFKQRIVQYLLQAGRTRALCARLGVCLMSKRDVAN
eukprot:scaffold298939_cov19-Prasinocladus_malaysianus.AAC.2